MSDTAFFDDVTDVVAQTLGIQDRRATLTPDTPLLGSLPELDSLAVLEVVEGLQSRFDIEVEDDELTGEVFETLGSLTDFVAAKRA